MSDSISSLVSGLSGGTQLTEENPEKVISVEGVDSMDASREESFFDAQPMVSEGAGEQQDIERPLIAASSADRGDLFEGTTPDPQPMSDSSIQEGNSMNVSDADSEKLQIITEASPSSNKGLSDVSLDTSSLQATTDESKDNSFNVQTSQDVLDMKKKDLKRKRADQDTESVSDDDLPEDGKMETEAISDDELRTGGISGAETVSDDELLPAQKRSKVLKNKSKRGKKMSSFKLINWDDILARVQTSKSLPELEKYWKVVRDDPSDFTGWTYLLQYVDQENDVTAARDAYDSFLSMYPYCYGYWRKYADYEKRKGDKAVCEEVFRRGLRAIPLSVDLWAHYLAHCRTTMKDDEDLLREQFELAIEKCGLEFRSDRLWALYIQWEGENRRYQRVLGIYDRLLETPIQNLKSHFEDLQHLISRHRPCKILSVDEFFSIRASVVSKLKSRNAPIDTSSNPPGEGEDTGSSCSDEETVYMRERMVALRYKVYKATMSQIAERLPYEASIKRPYFHIKPLEKSQLENWAKYLDYEISAGDFKRTVVLFERAMIACAMYQQFWLKYVRYLEQCSCDRSMIQNVYRRACLVHLPKSTHLALSWAAFEEQQGNLNSARRILVHTAEISNNLLLVQLRHIHFERRCGNMAKVDELFEHYIAHSTQKCAVLALMSKYAQFCQRSLKDAPKAKEILKQALTRYPDDSRLYYQLLGLIQSNSLGFDESCVKVFNAVLESRAVNMETKVQFSQAKLEYCQDFGTKVADVVSAQKEYLNILQAYRELQAEKYKAEGMYYYSKRIHPEIPRKEALVPSDVERVSGADLIGVNHSVTEAVTNALKVTDVSDADVTRGKAQLKAQVLYAGEKADTLLADIINQAALLGSARAPADLLAEIDAVSTQSVQQALRSFVDSKKSLASIGAVQKVPYTDDL